MPEFRLSRLRTNGVSCDADGAFVGAIPLLNRLQKGDKDAWHPRESEELSEQISGLYGLPVDMSSKTGGLKAIANALNEDDVARGQIATVLLGIPDAPRPATNADWIDPLISVIAAGIGIGSATVGPVARVLGEITTPVAESDTLIGSSGFRGIGEFTDAVTTKYQTLYDEHYAGTMQLVSRDLIPDDPLIIGKRTDALARVDLRDWLENIEGIKEGRGQIIQVNRRLYDPLGSGNYRMPDVYIPESQTILDGSLQFKTNTMPQITDYQAFSRGAKVIIIRPSVAPSVRVAGSYGIVH